MLYIGTSLGSCLKSILAEEVSEDEVVVIITRTRCQDFESYIHVVRLYFAVGNPNSSTPEKYQLSEVAELDEAIELAHNLWYKGKIHQPLLFGENYPMLLPTWLIVSPQHLTNNPAILDAWDKYKVLRTLMDE